MLIIFSSFMAILISRGHTVPMTGDLLVLRCFVVARPEDIIDVIEPPGFILKVGS